MRISALGSREFHGGGDYIDRAAAPPLGVDRLFPLVVPAVRANPMRHLRLVAVGAFRQGRSRQGVVGAPLVAPCLAVTSFGIGHVSTPAFSLPRRGAGGRPGSASAVSGRPCLAGIPPEVSRLPSEGRPFRSRSRTPRGYDPRRSGGIARGIPRCREASSA